MATHLIGTSFDLGHAHQPAPANRHGVLTTLGALADAFNDATAAEHIYQGLIAHDIPADEAARRTFEMLYGKRDTR